MKLLEERILRDGKVYPGEVLKVNSFLNHMIDINLLDKMGEEICGLFSEDKVTKILTVEASGIALACMAARHMNVPVLFAKKSKTSNVSDNLYSADVYSYTHQQMNKIVVEKDFLMADDNVLIVDDFLAKGSACRGLMELIKQAGARTAGISVAIEKGFQGGGDGLRKEGVKVRSLAIIESMTDSSIAFRKE